MVSNKRVAELAGIGSMSCEVRRRRWIWLGHVFRKKGGEWLYNSTRLEVWGPKSEGKGEDDLEEDCRERTGQGRLDKLEYGQNSSPKQGGLDWQRDGLMRLRARWALMMMMLSRKPRYYEKELNLQWIRFTCKVTKKRRKTATDTNVWSSCINWYCSCKKKMELNWSRASKKSH